MAFSAEDIKDGDTRFKCAPPIRDAANKEKLWEALMVSILKFHCTLVFKISHLYYHLIHVIPYTLQDGDIDMLSSDHSPSVPELKLFDEGDFLRAWGGISSLQVGVLAHVICF